MEAQSPKTAESRPVHPMRGTSRSEFDIGDAIESFPCRDAYLALEECLGTFDRDWTKCQKEVAKLKKCYKDSQESKKIKQM
mmetsp:Transcript_2316/g.6934  ORF Transcript_2316/g.6934 Transcript_2316/m.6934 type:complete len:81 (-) Transcript_2316:17-259(-)